MTIKELEDLEQGKELESFVPADHGLFSPENAKKQADFIRDVMKACMKNGEHYGLIQGCGPKPTLLQPGAEILCMVFRLAPSYEVIKTNLPNGHREYEVISTLKDINTGIIQGSGVGMATSMESKYRYRKAGRLCPACGEDTILKSKFKPFGWYCYAKKGGCGEQFALDEPAIIEQEVGKVENDDPADQFNTILKMAKKRALVDNTKSTLAASNIFTQDVEDMKPDAVPDDEGAPPSNEEGGEFNQTDASETISTAEAEFIVKMAKENNWTETNLKAMLKKDFKIDMVVDITYKMKPEVLKRLRE